MNDYKNKKVLVMGLARSGLAAIDLLLKLGADVTVSEGKPLDQVKEREELGAKGVKLISQSEVSAEDGYSLVIKNPGINGKQEFVQQFVRKGIPVTTEIELAFDVCPDQHYIAVTGTNGKTTTCTLLYEVMEKAFPGRAYLSGNIGTALCRTIIDNNLMDTPGCYIVLEISNFQLLDIIRFRPEVSVIINLAPDHLDFMGSEDAYYRSKARVYENQKEGDIFLKNLDDALVDEYNGICPVNCRTVTYSLVNPSADYFADEEFVYACGEKLFPVSSIKVVGRHNVQNVLVAVSAARSLGAADEDIIAAVSSFKGVEHRIEYVRELDGVKYYNDSKGTNVDATVIALRAFSCHVFLLAGGHEKGLPLEPLKALLGNVTIVAYGECGPRIYKELADESGVLVENLQQAVDFAHSKAEAGDVVLLSPTTSSYDQYTCFEERGEHFKSLVNAL